MSATNLYQKWRQTRGSITLQVAFSLMAILTFVALGAEVTNLLLQRKRMQNAADAAVIAAGNPALNAASSVANPRTFTAIAVAASHGFVHGQNNTTVTYGTPIGTYATIGNAGQVIITRIYSPGLIALFRPGNITVRASATTIPGRQSTGCILALNSTMAKAVQLANTAKVTNTNCEMAINSSNAGALDMLNGAIISGPVYIVGDYTKTATASFTNGPVVRNAGTPIVDPYAQRDLTINPACTYPSTSVYTVSNNTSVTFSNAAGVPVRFCGGLDIKGGNKAVITFTKGTYFIDKSLSIGNGTTIDATNEVTLIIGNNVTSFSLGNGVSFKMKAPLSGTFTGIALYSNSTGTISFNNGASLLVEGALYLPKMTANFAGNLSSTGASCTQLIADNILLDGNFSFQADCGASNVSAIGRNQPILVE